MATLRQLWATLRTQDFPNGGTDANLFLEFGQSGKSFKLPDQPGDDLERSASTSYLFNVPDLDTTEFTPGTVSLRNDNTGNAPGWRCESVLILGIGQDGKYYPLVAMTDVDRWLASDEPEGLTMTLDILNANEIGVPGA
jgi:hypothetical protein